MNVLVLLVASYGMCFGLMNEKLPVLSWILSRLPIARVGRENFFERMFACSYCTGFHTGWITWAASRVIGSGSLQEDVVGGVLFAFASSAFCYSLDVTLQRLEN
tara:strand:- start:578 stop:889 length:312 start_codon:yes stop_codon:yes gene_type:complete